MNDDDDINLREPRPLTKMRWADVDKNALLGVVVLVFASIIVVALLVNAAAWLVKP